MGESEFPKRLEALCEKLNRKQYAVAECCGVDRSTFWRYMRGDIAPSVEALENIADYFDVSVDYLLGRTNNPQINR